MKKIILGIHGLKNKPARELLQTWWEQSIYEGLKKIGHPDTDFEFELVYWADYNYSEPLDPTIKEEDNPLYLTNPYIPGDIIQEPKEPSELKKKILDTLEVQMDKLFLKEDSIGGLEAITDVGLRLQFKDLDVYYHGNCLAKDKLVARDALRGELTIALNKHANKQIMLVSHSMGTIIAYDTLMHTVPDINIDTFVTLGSPLGLPMIMKKIFSELKIEVTPEVKPPVPENIQSGWYNYSDLNDKIAINYNLADDFAANSRGLGITDIVVQNDYQYKGEANPHKVYGYLRTPELADLIYKFLGEK